MFFAIIDAPFLPWNVNRDGTVPLTNSIAQN